MSHLILKQMPRYECLLEASTHYPDLNPKACEAFLHLLHVGDELMRHFGVYFQRHGLSQGRFAVLMLLLQRVPSMRVSSTPAGLADMCSCTRATMTGLIDTLEKDGYVRREPDAEDRRVMHVHLTETGQKFISDLLPEHFRMITSLMSALSEEEQNTLVGLLDKVLQKVGRDQVARPDSDETETFPA